MKQWGVITLVACAVIAVLAVAIFPTGMRLGFVLKLLGTLSGFVAATAVMHALFERRLLKTQLNEHRSPCGRLRSACDLVPSPILRKRVTKLIADQERHIAKLKREKRLAAARWIRLCTWLLFLWYIAGGIVLALIDPLLRRRSE